jgi:hypothetical protein
MFLLLLGKQEKVPTLTLKKTFINILKTDLTTTLYNGEGFW